MNLSKTFLLFIFFLLLESNYSLSKEKDEVLTLRDDKIGYIVVSSKINFLTNQSVYSSFDEDSNEFQNKLVKEKKISLNNTLEINLNSNLNLEIQVSLESLHNSFYKIHGVDSSFLEKEKSFSKFLFEEFSVGISYKKKIAEKYIVGTKLCLTPIEYNSYTLNNKEISFSKDFSLSFFLENELSYGILYLNCNLSHDFSKNKIIDEEDRVGSVIKIGSSTKIEIINGLVFKVSDNVSLNLGLLLLYNSTTRNNISNYFEDEIGLYKIKDPAKISLGTQISFLFSLENSNNFEYGLTILEDKMICSVQYNFLKLFYKGFM